MSHSGSLLPLRRALAHCHLMACREGCRASHVPTFQILASAPRLLCVHRFWEYVFNPTGTLVDEEERAFLSERLQAFISREGLHSPELALPRGYLTRGNALHFMHQTNKDFYALKDRIQARKDAAELREEL